MDTPQKETVEVLSVIGDSEKSWSIDRYHLMVGISILSVVFIMGGIVWLASGGDGNAGSKATPVPSGTLDFNEKEEVAGAQDIRKLPYPSVRNAMPLVPGKSTAPSKSVSKTPTPMPTSAPAATETPIPTPTPANTTIPSNTDTPPPSQAPVTPSIEPSISPSVTQ